MADKKDKCSCSSLSGSIQSIEVLWCLIVAKDCSLHVADAVTCEADSFDGI